MHNLVPHFILENFARGNLQGEFPAAGLFLDITGFTNLTETLLQHGQHGAEVLATVMRAIFDPLVHQVYAHGGFVSGFAGDAFTAVFPRVEGRRQKAETDDASSSFRALAAAWRMQEHMRANTSYDTLYGSFPITAKIGLGAGQVNWGILESADQARAAYYFRGSAIDCCVT
ncbi:MAG TPA: adenylate/guanylate cyclase domain-containing protein, partial [Anaerolineae bacterium]